MHRKILVEVLTIGPSVCLVLSRVKRISLSQADSYAGNITPGTGHLPDPHRPQRATPSSARARAVARGESRPRSTSPPSLIWTCRPIA